MESVLANESSVSAPPFSPLRPPRDLTFEDSPSRGLIDLHAARHPIVSHAACTVMVVEQGAGPAHRMALAGHATVRVAGSCGAVRPLMCGRTFAPIVRM